MSFYGPEETITYPDFCNQYKTRLDIVGLGLTALELLCATALSSRDSWGPQGLRGSWRRLFLAWEKHREEVTRWHTMIYRVFSAGGDIGPLYQQLAQERVVDRVAEHIVKIRTLLRTCISRTEDHKIQSLLGVLADMIDEKSTVGLLESVEALGPDTHKASASHASVLSPQSANQEPLSPPTAIAAAALPSTAVAQVSALPFAPWPRTAPGVATPPLAPARSVVDTNTGRLASPGRSALGRPVVVAQPCAGQGIEDPCAFRWPTPPVATARHGSFVPAPPHQKVPMSASFEPPAKSKQAFAAPMSGRQAQRPHRMAGA